MALERQAMLGPDGKKVSREWRHAKEAVTSRSAGPRFKEVVKASFCHFLALV